MKILTMADVESSYFWGACERKDLKKYDLILSAGDLNPQYLIYIETLSNQPLLYIHGNHDEKYAHEPPEGCECIEDRIYVHDGIRILGLGGSMRYRNGLHQYREKDMRRRIFRLKRQLKKFGGFDILLTHAPMKDFHDADDLCHQGFAALRELVEQYQPKYFIHGHVHMNYGLKTPRLSMFGNTIVINAYHYFAFEYDDPAILEEAKKITE